MSEIKDLLDKLYDVQVTYIGNKFDDVATQEMLQDLVAQVNIMQRIIRLLANA